MFEFGELYSIAGWTVYSGEVILMTAGTLFFGYINYRGIGFAGALQLTVNRDGLRLSRRGLQTAEMHHRYWRGEVRSLRIFIDRSSVEIFINDGEGVMSSRYFPTYPGQLIFNGSKPGAFCYWPLRPCMVE